MVFGLFEGGPFGGFSWGFLGFFTLFLGFCWLLVGIRLEIKWLSLVFYHWRSSAEEKGRGQLGVCVFFQAFLVVFFVFQFVRWGVEGVLWRGD